MKMIQFLFAIIFAIFVGLTTSFSLQKPAEKLIDNNNYEKDMLMAVHHCTIRLTNEKFKNHIKNKKRESEIMEKNFLSTKTDEEKKEYHENNHVVCTSQFLDIYLLADEAIKQCENMERVDIHELGREDFKQCVK
ncbi:hypothetical protein BDAP_002495 [Binucleata daphniae]